MLEGQIESFQNLYVITVSVSLAMTVILYLKRMLSPAGGRSGLFRCLYAAIATVMACDLAWALTERAGVQSVAVSFACNATWFVCFTVVCVLWFQLFNRQMRGVRLRGTAGWAAFLLPAAATVVLTVASAHGHWIVDISANGTYRRGPFFGLAYATYAFYALSAIMLALANAVVVRGDATERRHCLTMSLVPLPLLATLALQALTSGINFAFIGLVFSLALYEMDSERRIAEIKADVRGELERIAEERMRDRTRREEEEYANVSKDQMLSLITKQLYGFNLIVDLEADSFSVIVGTGMDAIVAEFGKASSYREAYAMLDRFVRPECRDALRSLISLDYMRNAASRAGLVGRCECAADAPGGGEVWCEVNVIMGRYGRGRPVANILVRNITESREAEAVREREAKAAMSKDQILSGITQAIYSFNITVDLAKNTYSVIPGTGLERLVRMLERLSDTPYTAAVDKVLSFIDEADRAKARSILGRDYLMAYKGRRGLVVSREIPFVGGDGRSGWCEVHVFMGVNGAGEPVANLLGRDVTAIHERQIQREREMKAVAAKDQILSGITQAIYGYNLTVNLKTLKYTLIAGTGMDTVCDIFRRSDDYAEAFVSTLGFVDHDYTERVAGILSPDYLRRQVAGAKSGALGSFEYRAIVDGHEQWHETNVFIGTDAHGDPIANILGRNITELHEQADTERRLLVAEQSSAAKTSFLFSMSHDIRTPMNAILGYVAMARKYSENPMTMNCLGKIEVAGHHLLALINQVLEMSRIESGRIALAERPMNVTKQTRAAVTIVAANAGLRGVSLETRLGQIGHPDVLGDPDRIEQILVNILGNAIKYTPEGGRVVFSVEEASGAEDGESSYTMTVTDTGIGMSEEFQRHIFETFTRENNTTVSGIQGTGLGMSIVKRLVDMMGGAIDISSKRGAGTKVTVVIPLRWNGTADEKGVPSRAEGESAFSLNGRRVLLVEDNEMNREIARWMLTEQGMAVEEAVNGREAVEKFREGEFDYVLMDIQMPVMDGYAATREIRDIERSRGTGHIPIVALSANAFEEDRMRSLDAGMDDHLAKPIKVGALVAALRGLS